MPTVEPASEHESGPCPCCGDITRTVWGYVQEDEARRAVYYARFTRDNPDHGALFFVSMGVSDIGASERIAVACDARAPDGRIAFMVIDAARTPWNGVAELGRKLSRDEVIGTPTATRVFAILDSALEADPRLIALRTMLERRAPSRRSTQTPRPRSGRKRRTRK